MKTRLFVANILQLQESGYDATKGLLTVRVIQPGFNKSKGRYYPADMLKRDFKVFEGAKMFANHQTENEAEARPEGDVNNWVASMGKVWCENDGTVMGEAKVVDPVFGAKLAMLQKQGLLKDMGISIRAIGQGQDQMMEGAQTKVVESLVKARSVDFVTYAGAGGRVEAIESEQDPNDVDLITEADFRSRRPDLVEAVRKETQMNEKELAELKEAAELGKKAIADLAIANARIAAIEAEKLAAEKATKIAETSKELTNMLVASKLPKIAVERLTKQFVAAESVEGMKEAIDSEVEYVKSLTPITKNNGVDDNRTDVSEADKAKVIVNLEEAFTLIGCPKDVAKLAAKG